MTRYKHRALFLTGAIFGLAACGSEPAEGPTEQIIVAEPGQSAAPAAEPAAEPDTGSEAAPQ